MPRRCAACPSRRLRHGRSRAALSDVIDRLLRERPNVAGLAVPGMPMGSPGMEGPRKDPYNVLTFDDAGNTAIYESR